MLAWWTNVFNTEITGTLTDSHHLDVPRGFSHTHTAFVSRPVIFFYKHTSATRLLQKPPAEDCSSVLQVTICVFEPLTLVSQPQTALRDTTDLKSISPPPLHRTKADIALPAALTAPLQLASHLINCKQHPQRNPPGSQTGLFTTPVTWLKGFCCRRSNFWSTRWNNGAATCLSRGRL